jgi:hypothetical protein
MQACRLPCRQIDVIDAGMQLYADFPGKRCCMHAAACRRARRPSSLVHAHGRGAATATPALCAVRLQQQADNSDRHRPPAHRVSSQTACSRAAARASAASSRADSSAAAAPPCAAAASAAAAARSWRAGAAVGGVRTGASARRRTSLPAHHPKHARRRDTLAVYAACAIRMVFD